MSKDSEVIQIIAAILSSRQSKATIKGIYHLKKALEQGLYPHTDSKGNPFWPASEYDFDAEVEDILHHEKYKNKK